MIVQPVTALLPARIALAIGIDRLLAQRLRNALERARLLAAEKEDGGAAADDGLRVIFIHGAQLALRLHEDMRRDVAAPDDGDQPLEIRDLLVRKLVQQAGYMHRQPPAIGERLVAERVEQLRIQYRGDEVERRIGVRHDAKQRGLTIAHLVQCHLVVGHELTDLLDVERREARSAGDQDALHGLRGGVLDFLVLAGRKVIRLVLRELFKQ